MATEEINASSGHFVITWRYIAREALEACRIFVSPARNIREVETIVEVAKAHTPEYIALLSRASVAFSWKFILRQVWIWLKNLLRGRSG